MQPLDILLAAEKHLDSLIGEESFQVLLKVYWQWVKYKDVFPVRDLNEA